MALSSELKEHESFCKGTRPLQTRRFLAQNTLMALATTSLNDEAAELVPCLKGFGGYRLNRNFDITVQCFRN